MMNSNINYSDTDSEIEVDEEMSQVPNLKRLFKRYSRKAPFPKFEFST